MLLKSISFALGALALAQTQAPIPAVIPPHFTIMVNGQPTVATIGDNLNVTSFVQGGQTYYQINVTPPYARSAYFMPATEQSTFTLTGAPGVGVHVYRNGLRMSPGLDYNSSSNQITFFGQQIPQPGDQVVVDY